MNDNTNNVPKVSIVVPIYNVEKYLRQCVDSILAQTLEDIEVILVNDGSPDNCGAIIEEYARADARVKVITQPNGGYGKAVNRGLDMARGEYVGIIEPDDWIETDMYESLYALAEENQLQIAKGLFYNYTEKNGDVFNLSLPVECMDRVIEPKRNAIILFYSHSSICTAIYKRSFLNENHIRCLESPGASYQDVGFGFKTLVMSERMWIMSRPLHHYRRDNPTQSTSAAAAKGKMFCIVNEWDEIDRYLKEYPALRDATYSLREHLRMMGYTQYFKYICRGREQEKFIQLSRETFESALQHGAYDRDYFDSKTWSQIQQGIYPHSVKVRVKKVLRKMFSWLWKERLEMTTKRVFYLFRIIRVGEKEIKRPVVHYMA